MARRFNTPPGWPPPPVGFTEDMAFIPDPSWPKPPRHWQLWVEDDIAQPVPVRRSPPGEPEGPLYGIGLNAQKAAAIMKLMPRRLAPGERPLLLLEASSFHYDRILVTSAMIYCFRSFKYQKAKFDKDVDYGVRVPLSDVRAIRVNRRGTLRSDLTLWDSRTGIEFPDNIGKVEYADTFLLELVIGHVLDGSIREIATRDRNFCTAEEIASDKQRSASLSETLRLAYELRLVEAQRPTAQRPATQGVPTEPDGDLSIGAVVRADPAARPAAAETELVILGGEHTVSAASSAALRSDHGDATAVRHESRGPRADEPASYVEGRQLVEDRETDAYLAFEAATEDTGPLAMTDKLVGQMTSASDALVTDTNRLKKNVTLAEGHIEVALKTLDNARKPIKLGSIGFSKRVSLTPTDLKLPGGQLIPLTTGLRAEGSLYGNRVAQRGLLINHENDQREIFLRITEETGAEHVLSWERDSTKTFSSMVTPSECFKFAAAINTAATRSDKARAEAASRINSARRDLFEARAAPTAIRSDVDDLAASMELASELLSALASIDLQAIDRGNRRRAQKVRDNLRKLVEKADEERKKAEAVIAAAAAYQTQPALTDGQLKQPQRVHRGPASTATTRADVSLGPSARESVARQLLSAMRQLAEQKKAESVIAAASAHQTRSAVTEAPPGSPPPDPLDRGPASTTPASTDSSPEVRPTHLGAGQILEAIRQLAELHSAGILTDEEFAGKKAELLSRL
jgi:hypothetical protein